MARTSDLLSSIYHMWPLLHDVTRSMESLAWVERLTQPDAHGKACFRCHVPGCNKTWHQAVVSGAVSQHVKKSHPAMKLRWMHERHRLTPEEQVTNERESLRRSREHQRALKVRFSSTTFHSIQKPLMDVKIRRMNALFLAILWWQRQAEQHVPLPAAALLETPAKKPSGEDQACGTVIHGPGSPRRHGMKRRVGIRVVR